MINSIEIKNIKSIKEKKFKLKNLNLLLGLNGMGKSSFIQSILLLKQSDRIHENRLDLDGTYTNLGTAADVFYQYKNEEMLYLKLTFSNDKQVEFTCKYHPETDYLISDSPTINTKIRETEALFNKNFQYLNANRGEPVSLMPKNYTHVVDNKNIGNNGQYTAHYIETYGADNIIFENLIHKDSITIDSVTGKNIENKSLINQINLWMGEISPNVHVRTSSVSSNYVLLEYAFKQPNLGFTNKFTPSNVGFGISYGLPIVTALLSARPGELLIIENPESHIHPRGQAELGKLIAKTAMNNVQIIVETHSDHILNGIRVAVKEKDISKNNVAVFYFDKVVTESEQYANVTDIFIDDNGELSEYPINMLDEWTNQLFKLM